MIMEEPANYSMTIQGHRFHPDTFEEGDELRELWREMADNVTGVGNNISARVLHAFPSREQLEAATVEDFTEVDLVSERKAEYLVEHFDGEADDDRVSEALEGVER